MKRNYLIAVLIALSIWLTGCGSGAPENTTATDNINTGTFVDSPVYGLRYKTATQEGFTNQKGEFTYKNDEKIEFFLNTLSLGKVNASVLITPYTMAGDTNISNPSKKASNIALLLQNFDANKSNSKTIDVSAFKDLGDYNLSYIDLNSTTNAMETEITELLATGGFQQYVDDSNLTLVNTETVNNTMKNYAKEDTASYETGFGSRWVDGKILYDVYQNLENGDINNPQWSAIEATSLKFENGKMKIAAGVSTNYLHTFDYNITSEGLITYMDDFNYENDPNFVTKQRWIHFNSQTSDFIEVCYADDKTAVMGCDSSHQNHEVLFLDETKAKTALGNANFFDYIGN